MAARDGSVDMLKYMVDKGANVHVDDKEKVGHETTFDSVTILLLW